MDRWEGIEELVAICTAGSFVGGARKLGISTSQISRIIARLEDRVQGAVLNRTTRRLTLTDSGRLLRQQFERIIQERDEAFAMVQGGREPQGDLRITCSATLGERFVGPIVREFAMLHPRVTIYLELTNRVLDLVAEGFDLAIRTGEITDSRLSTVPIASRQPMLCAAPAYLEHHPPPVSVLDLQGHECLGGSSSHWGFLVEGQKHNIQPQGRWHCNSGTSVLDALLAGMGIAQLPDFYVAKHVEEGRLIELLEEARPPAERIWAVYPHRRHLTPKVSRLIALLAENLPRALRQT